MRADSPRWHVVEKPAHAAEAAAQRHLRELLPDSDPYQGWTNLKFVSNGRKVREVDLLLLTPYGLYLVEIKSFHGQVSGTRRRWTHTNRGAFLGQLENPLFVTDAKAKELSSRLKWAAKELGLPVRVPFVQPVVFLSEPDLVCDLDPEERAWVYGPDRRSGGGSGLPDVTELWTSSRDRDRNGRRGSVDAFASALPALLGRLGVTAAPAPHPAERLPVGDRAPEIEPAEVGPGRREYSTHSVDRGSGDTPERKEVASTTDPWKARQGDRLGGGLVVRQVLEQDDPSSGRTRTLLVERNDDRSSVLRVAETDAGAGRLEREARNLRLRGLDLLSVLEDLDAAGVYHRDLTPDRIVLRQDGDRTGLVLVGFSQSSVPLGQAGTGRSEYRGRRYGRHDRYAERHTAALTLHEMVTGRLTCDAYLCEHRLGPFPAHLDRALTAFFERALHYSPHDRTVNATALRKAWKRALRPEPATSGDNAGTKASDEDGPPDASTPTPLSRLLDPDDRSGAPSLMAPTPTRDDVRPVAACGRPVVEFATEHRLIVSIVALAIGLPVMIWVVPAVVGWLLEALLILVIALVVLRLLAPLAVLGGLVGTALSLALGNTGAALLCFGVSVAAGILVVITDDWTWRRVLTASRCGSPAPRPTTRPRR